MKRLRGIKALLHDVAEITLDLVEEGHSSVARNVMRVLDRVEPVAGPAREVESARHWATSGVFGGGRWLNRAIERVTDEGLQLALETVIAKSPSSPETPVPLRSDITDSRAWLGDAALGVLNGVVGDHLSDKGNGLDLGMRLRHGDAFLELDPVSLARQLPEAKSRVLLLIHGLSATEWSWCINSSEYHGDPGRYFGSIVAEALDASVILVRYNSGRHISENGRALAEQLEALFAAYPREAEEIIVVGHSMGGLLARSACHYGDQLGHAWRARVSRVFCLGSPHHGAPLEKVGNIATAVLSAIDLPGTRIPGRILSGRSAGIKDLRYGNLLDEDWQDHDPDEMLRDKRTEVALLDGVAYHFMAATVTRDPAHPLGQIIGDMLVRLPSATGPRQTSHRFRIDTKTFGGVLHHQLQNHPDVVAAVLAACRGEAPAQLPDLG